MKGNEMITSWIDTLAEFEVPDSDVAVDADRLLDLRYTPQNNRPCTLKWQDVMTEQARPAGS